MDKVKRSRRVVDVLRTALKRKGKDTQTAIGLPRALGAEGRDIYIRSEQKEVNALIQKEKTEKMERETRTGDTRKIPLNEVERL